MLVNIEDAGFEIRDVVSWIYGQGFPKSQNIHKSLTKLCTCGNMEADEKTRDNKREASEQETEHGMRSMQGSDIQEAINAGKECGQVLQQSLQEQGSHGSVLRGKPKEGSEDGEEPSVEGWSDLQATEGELHGSEVCEMPEGVLGNGKKGRLHNGASPSNGSEHGKTFNTDRGSSPRGSQSEQQQDRKPCPLCDEWGTQTIRRAASETQGLGSALKPSVEFFTLCRKPLSEKTIAKNVLKWGTGGINIDACRVEGKPRTTHKDGNFSSVGERDETMFNMGDKYKCEEPQGRFPANLIHDGSPEVLELFPEARSNGNKSNSKSGHQDSYVGGNLEKKVESSCYSDKGSAARFFKSIETEGSEITDSMRLDWLASNADVCDLEPHFCLNQGSRDMRVEIDKRIVGDEDYAPRAFYCAKASKKDRNEGCDELENGNNHATVKPTALMAYLCRLITPPNGVVLDPYMGSGSTGKAAVREGFRFVGIELDPDYYEIAKARVNHEA